MVYLGASLAADQPIHFEVARRTGAARAGFQRLQRVWARASAPVKDKGLIYEACVVSPYMYSLQAAWLHIAAQRYLDAFRAKVLRRICNIPPSFISCVSNADAFARTAYNMKLSSRASVRQLALAGRRAAGPAGTPMQRSVGRLG